MKKPVPTFNPVIRARNSHLIHLGDRANSNPDRVFSEKATQCGRMLDHADVVFSFAYGFEAEMLLDERWKKYVSFNPRRRHKAPVLCERCGTPQDFHDAWEGYQAYRRAADEYSEFWRNREKEIYEQLVHLRNKDMRALFEDFANNGIPLKLDETDDHFTLHAEVNGRLYKISHEGSLNNEVHKILETEKEAAENE